MPVPACVMTHGADVQQMERQIHQISQNHPHSAGMAEQCNMQDGATTS